MLGHQLANAAEHRRVVLAAQALDLAAGDRVPGHTRRRHTVLGHDGRERRGLLPDVLAKDGGDILQLVWVVDAVDVLDLVLELRRREQAGVLANFRALGGSRGCDNPGKNNGLIAPGCGKVTVSPLCSKTPAYTGSSTASATGETGFTVILIGVNPVVVNDRPRGATLLNAILRSRDGIGDGMGDWGDGDIVSAIGFSNLGSVAHRDSCALGFNPTVIFMVQQ